MKRLNCKYSKVKDQICNFSKRVNGKIVNIKKYRGQNGHLVKEFFGKITEIPLDMCI